MHRKITGWPTLACFGWACRALPRNRPARHQAAGAGWNNRQSRLPAPVGSVSVAGSQTQEHDDHKTLDYLRRKRMLGGRLHIDHDVGPTEPMLWISDVCCGAITQMRCGDQHCYGLIQAKLTLINIRA
jgi:hypothetical protein